jgi:formate dehydrogenase major subunit
LAWEATKKQASPEFFARHSVADLARRSDYWLEEQGRITRPMVYDPGTDHYVPVDWEKAFALVGEELRALSHPNQAEFYTSGRSSNEAAFLYQLFAREFGTTFPTAQTIATRRRVRGCPRRLELARARARLRTSTRPI